MSCRCRGSTVPSRPTGHFSTASGSTVWLVYSKMATVIPHASSQPRPSWSTNRRISLGMAMAGWVSLSSTAFLAANSAKVGWFLR